MEGQIVKILAADYVTHNVRHFVVEKPEGFSYIPGQATDVSINRPGFEQELRPFTFTSLPDAAHLEFVIKIYKDRKGVTAQLSLLQPGDELILHEVFGAINYQGPGVFIAGGAGITPFLAILRSIKQTGDLAKCTLLFANHTEADIILREELEALLGEHCVHILSTPLKEGRKSRIDKELLSEHLVDPQQFYYVCGPDQFTADMVRMLGELGIEDDHIVIEQ